MAEDSKKRTFSEYAEDSEQRADETLQTHQDSSENNDQAGMTKNQRKKRRQKENRSRRGADSTEDAVDSQAPDILPIDAAESAANDTRPGLQFVPHRLNSKVQLSQLRDLVLYCLADGVAPQWISVRNHQHIQKAVVLLVPGLEQAMFDGVIALDDAPSELRPSSEPAENQQSSSVPADGPLTSHNESTEVQSQRNPDDYFPLTLIPDELPTVLKPIANVFPHMWPIKSPGDDRISQVHSPLHTMLTTSINNRPEERHKKKLKGVKPVKVDENWKDERTVITAFLASKDELLENKFILHPSLFHDTGEEKGYLESRRIKKVSYEDGWQDAVIRPLSEDTATGENAPNGDDGILAGRKAYALDCEMCRVGDDEYALTRISVVSWDGELIMDELVKPDKPIIDYVTQFSGITETMLAPVTTRLADIQERLLTLLTSETILIGHSLDSDLTAIKLAHPSIVDTSIIYPHPRGPPCKSSLKFLAQKYLNREIQKGHGSKGHDSIEDAKACLDLVRQKCEKGPLWGTSDSTSEPVFKRIARSGKSKQISGSANLKSGAIVDHGSPERSFGQMAPYSIGCKDDAGIVQAIKRCVLGDIDGEYIPGGGVELTWARLRELDVVRGWANNNRHGQSLESPIEPTNSELRTAVSGVANHIQEIREFLPPCTLFVVYSGTGDPRKLARMQEMHRQFKKEYQTKKWDQLSVKWTDVEQQEMSAACRVARAGIGFVCVT